MAQITKGSYVSDGTAKLLDIHGADTVELFIQGDATGDNWDSSANPAVTKYARWFNGMTAGHAFTIQNTAGAATDEMEFLVTGGFTYYDGSLQSVGPEVTGTQITAASPAVVSDVAHGFVTGDRVVLSNCTDMKQLEGMTFTVTWLTADTYSLPIDASGFAAPASAVTARKLQDLPYQPSAKLITGITVANPCVVSVSETHNFVVGSVVKLFVPSEYDMTEADGLQGKVTAIGTNSITLDVDSSAFTAFEFPLTTEMEDVSKPQVVLVGGDATILTNSVENTSVHGLVLGTGIVGPADATVYYTATKADLVE